MSTKPHNERSVLRNFDLNDALEDDDEKAKESIDIFPPFIGQCVLSLEETFLFYKNFARSCGFNVRKGRSENKNGVKRRQDFFCSCEGCPPPKVINPAVEQRNRESHKCGCGSYMRVTLKRSFDIFPEEWQVTQFKDDHNHKLLSPEFRFLSTYRSIDKEIEERILLFKKASLSVRQIMRIIELKNNVKHDHLQFLAKDIHNLFGKIFVKLMKKPPLSNLTDQDICMTEVISKEMPTTKHAFCMWHITTNWCANFYKLYKLEDAEEFEQHWPQVIAKYNIQTNKLVLGLYRIRHYWVPGYLRSYFFVGMTATGRSESINAFIKRFVASRTCLSQFIKQVDLAIEDVKQSQLRHTMLETYRANPLRSMSPLEKQAFDILTPFCFKRFQDEFARASQYMMFEELANQVKAYSFCKHTGHNITCPHKEKFGGNANIPSNKKQKKNASRNEELNPIFSTKC
ncbi:hypothetical protein Cgig2_000667 [Carnegiea gigantea]|uniref:Protein FAR1-RELATED SEQUENCE n=1 Tax=Carnegiea gigantea TaxID=171969 RepID=A0A9Q1GS33_9CARY|nr:hypothetical protein Cgig2_000667 [Carnegiea gigantea]